MSGVLGFFSPSGFSTSPPFLTRWKSKRCSASNAFTKGRIRSSKVCSPPVRRAHSGGIECRDDARSHTRSYVRSRYYSLLPLQPLPAASRPTDFSPQPLGAGDSFPVLTCPSFCPLFRNAIDIFTHLRPGASFPLPEHPARGSSPCCPRRAETRPIHLIPQGTPVVSLWLSPGQEKHAKWYRKKISHGSAHRENVPAVVGSIDGNVV
jgi:hypothetical protein